MCLHIFTTVYHFFRKHQALRICFMLNALCCVVYTPCFTVCTAVLYISNYFIQHVLERLCIQTLREFVPRFFYNCGLLV